MQPLSAGNNSAVEFGQAKNTPSTNLSEHHLPEDAEHKIVDVFVWLLTDEPVIDGGDNVS